MAEALVAGIIKSKLAGNDCLLATDISPTRLDPFLRIGIRFRTGPQNLDAVRWADVIILCVKPQVINDVLTEIQSEVSEKQLVISVAAGVPIKNSG